jgi:hypothetical protein
MDNNTTKCTLQIVKVKIIDEDIFHFTPDNPPIPLLLKGGKGGLFSLKRSSL